MRLLLFFFLSFCFLFSANAQQAMRPEMQQQLLKQLETMDPQKLQKQLEQMQQCVGKYSDELEALELEGQKIAKNIEQLCNAGERAKAQAFAKSEGNKFMKHQAIRKVQQCSKSLAKTLAVKSKLQPMPNQHICDQ